MKLLFGIFTENMSYPASMLGYLAKQNGWDVEIVFFQDNATEEDITNILIKYNPDLIALTMRTLERFTAFRVARAARQFKAKILAGGIHVTNSQMDVVSSGLFDGIVVGDGMGVWEDILHSYNTLDGQIIKGKPHPNASLYTKRIFSDSQKTKLKQSKRIDILSGLGCPFNCHFCSGTKHYMEFPIEEVVNQLVVAKRTFGIKAVAVQDETFSYSLKRLRSFRRLLASHGIGFLFDVQTRTNCFNKEIADELAALGVENVTFGVETVSPKLLKFINKRTTAEDAYHTAEICKQYNFPFRANFLFGLPTQDEEDYEITWQFIQIVKPDVICLYYFMPYPGSYLYDYCMQNGYFPDNFSFDKYSCIMENKPNLNKIDYDMADYYVNKIKDFDNEHKEDIIAQQALKADTYNWIIFGAADYFYRVLEMLSKYEWKNCLGYYDYRGDIFRTQDYNIKIPQYSLKAGSKRPDMILTTYHKGRSFNEIIQPIIREKFKYNGEIVSVSSFKHEH